MYLEIFSFLLFLWSVWVLHDNYRASQVPGSSATAYLRSVSFVSWVANSFLSAVRWSARVLSRSRLPAVPAYVSPDAMNRSLPSSQPWRRECEFRFFVVFFWAPNFPSRQPPTSRCGPLGHCRSRTSASAAGISPASAAFPGRRFRASETRLFPFAFRRRRRPCFSSATDLPLQRTTNPLRGAATAEGVLCP